VIEIFHHWQAECAPTGSFLRDLHFLHAAPRRIAPAANFCKSPQPNKVRHQINFRRSGAKIELRHWLASRQIHDPSKARVGVHIIYSQIAFLSKAQSKQPTMRSDKNSVGDAVNLFEWSLSL
jgi:hypothetical protein